MALEATVTGADPNWTATLALLDTELPVTTTGETAEAALSALVPEALRQVARACASGGIPLRAGTLAAAELRIRAAVSLALFVRSHPAPALQVVDTYGTDVSTFPDLDPQLALISGPRAVGEAVARRWLTPLGGLAYDKTYGEGLLGKLSGGVTRAQLAALEASLSAQAEADERVAQAAVTVAVSGPAGSATLSVKARLTLTTGQTFALVLTTATLAAATLEILRA